jgi:hypothetical protein
MSAGTDQEGGAGKCPWPVQSELETLAMDNGSTSLDMAAPTGLKSRHTATLAIARRWELPLPFRSPNGSRELFLEANEIDDGAGPNDLSALGGP